MGSLSRAAAAAAPALFSRLILKEIVGAGALSAGVFVADGETIAVAQSQLLGNPTGAVSTTQFGTYQGQLIRQLNAAGSYGGYTRQLSNNPSGWLAIAPGAGPRLRYGLTWRMAFDALGANNGHESGLIFKLDGNTGTGAPGTGSIPTHTIGVVGDTNGGMSLVTRAGGAESSVTPIVLPGLVTDLHDFAIVIEPPTASDYATFSLYAAGQLVRTISFGDPIMPTLAGAIAAGGNLGWCFDFWNAVAGAVAANLVFGTIAVTNTPVE